MAPNQPLLPTACNFPFQLAAGIQTSILMSESRVGGSVAATRQTAGRLRKSSAAGSRATAAPAGVGGANDPGPTVCARVILPLGTARDAKRSQGCGAGAV